MGIWPLSNLGNISGSCLCTDWESTRMRKAHEAFESQILEVKPNTQKLKKFNHLQLFWSYAGSSAASLGKQFQLAVCQHVLEDLEVQNSIAMPHLKSWKTSGLQKIGRVPNHVRSHKWDSWDHVCETQCVHKCVIQVAKAALLWTRLYKNSGSQRSIKSLQSGQSLRCSALHIGKKSLLRIVAKTGGRRKWIHNETPARRS